ncbi:hypothetical protein [Rubritalea profundi]|uniref:hypothetical protein n=1 Tax=Rubritalea profundi TaxID=1658618 RepID=UPI001F0BCC07|nr:hypothetical protein [Rubritalea profundi]
MGWDVQVRKDESQQEQFDARVSDASHGVGDQLGIDDETAAKLFRAGGATIELVLQMPAEYIAQAIEASEEKAQEILKKAEEAQQDADA